MLYCIHTVLVGLPGLKQWLDQNQAKVDGYDGGQLTRTAMWNVLVLELEQMGYEVEDNR